MNIHAGTTDEELEAMAREHVRLLRERAEAAGYPPPPGPAYSDALESARLHRDSRIRSASHFPFAGVRLPS